MSKADVKIVDGGGTVVPTRVFNVEAGASSSIKAGEPVKITGTGNNYVDLLAGGDPEIGTDRMVGIAANDSDDTASADGTVEVYMVKPDETVMRCNADTSGNLGDGILNDAVTFDVDSGTFKVDEDEGDDPDVHGLLIVGYDSDHGTVDFVLKQGASLSGEIS